jgi:hypothetical protein
MQRRAAAVSVAVFLVLAAGAYGMIGAAEEPDINVEGEHTLSSGGSFTAGGTTYEISSFNASGQATFQWVNESARLTASLENNTTVAYQPDENLVIPNSSAPGEAYTVLIANVSAPQNFTLREVQNVTQILADDPDVEDRIYRSDGTKFVRYVANDSLRELDAYLPSQNEVAIDLGSTLNYRGTGSGNTTPPVNATNVSAIAPGSATLSWIGPTTLTAEVSQGGNVTLDQTYLAHFETAEEQVVLSTDFEQYEDEVATQEYYHERRAGLWGVVLLSGMTAVLLLGMAYLPSRY